MNKTQEEYPLLVAQEGPLKGQRWQVSQTLVLGREASCDVVVADRQMSRYHARLTPTPEGVILEDLGSKNGTHHNGVPLTGPVVLQDGDLVSVALAQQFLFLTSDATMPLLEGTGHPGRLMIVAVEDPEKITSEDLKVLASAAQIISVAVENAMILGERKQGTRPLPAPKTLSGASATLERGGETLVLAYTDAHFPGDAWVWLPKHGVMFSGDLVYVDRLLGVLPWSSVKNGQQAFKSLAELKPARIVPGHGRVSDLAQAQRDTGDYYDFLAGKIGGAAKEMESLTATLDRYQDMPQFRHLYNYDDLHRPNMSRAFTEFESH